MWPAVMPTPPMAKRCWAGKPSEASKTCAAITGAGKSRIRRGLETEGYRGRTTAPTAGDIYIPMNFAGTVTAVRSVIDAPLATADVDLTMKINGVAMTGGVLTIAFSGSAAGDVDSITPTATNTFTAGQYLPVTSDGASTNAVDATLMFTITRT